jgi:hypothetical protein
LVRVSCPALVQEKRSGGKAEEARRIGTRNERELSDGDLVITRPAARQMRSPANAHFGLLFTLDGDDGGRVGRLGGGLRARSSRRGRIEMEEDTNARADWGRALARRDEAPLPNRRDRGGVERGTSALRDGDLRNAAVDVDRDEEHHVHLVAPRVFRINSVDANGGLGRDDLALLRTRGACQRERHDERGHERANATHAKAITLADIRCNTIASAS